MEKYKLPITVPVVLLQGSHVNQQVNKRHCMLIGSYYTATDTQNGDTINNHSETTSQETNTTITTTDSASSLRTSQDADGNMTVLGAVIGVLVALVAVALITLCIVVVYWKRSRKAKHR